MRKQAEQFDIWSQSYKMYVFFVGFLVAPLASFFFFLTAPPHLHLLVGSLGCGPWGFFYVYTYYSGVILLTVGRWHQQFLSSPHLFLHLHLPVSSHLNKSCPQQPEPYTLQSTPILISLRKRHHCLRNSPRPKPESCPLLPNVVPSPSTRLSLLPSDAKVYHLQMCSRHRPSHYHLGLLYTIAF